VDAAESSDSSTVGSINVDETAPTITSADDRRARAAGTGAT
jgi:hypothetical protein